MSIITDASPWGLGGILTVGTNIIAYYTFPLTKQDEEIFGHTIGEAHGQQSWESLACYVAVRLAPTMEGKANKTGDAKRLSIRTEHDAQPQIERIRIQPHSTRDGPLDSSRGVFARRSCPYTGRL